MGDYNDSLDSERDDLVRSEAAPEAVPSPYKVIAISIYRSDLEAADRKVAELKKRIPRASRSWLIRLALSRLDIDTVSTEDRP